RVAMPAAPTSWDPDHYFIAGVRDAPVLRGESMGSVRSPLTVFKENETYTIFGYDRRTFGIRRIDEIYGIAASRLAVTVNGVCYFWSLEGPRATSGNGPSKDLAWPLDLDAPAPASLVAEGALEDGFAIPILIGRPKVISSRIEQFGLGIKPDKDFEIINPQNDARYRDYVQTYYDLTCRKGITPDSAETIVRTRSTVIAALAVHRGEADAMICGVHGRFSRHLKHIGEVIGMAPGVRDFSTLSLIILSKGAYFLADTYVSLDPNAEEIAEMTLLTAAHVKRFGITPRIALLSHSNFGSSNSSSARKMRDALGIIRRKDPHLEVEGEMHGDAALDENYRKRLFPNSQLTGEANVLIMPNLDSANISYQLIKAMSDALPVGPILLGAAKPAHILTPSVTARGVVNMTALAVVDAQTR
ncbi:MAG: hypothetical protein IIB62_08200, partial [Proteobacteria bacterium]|nr:hypothetical protein [Pseudomonadota bacterium]